MDNLDIFVVITVSLCILGGLSRLLSFYAKNKTTSPPQGFLSESKHTLVQPNVGPTTPNLESGPESHYQSVTSSGPGQSGSEENTLDTALALVLPEAPSTWMEFFASPLIGETSEAVFTLAVVCIVPCV